MEHALLLCLHLLLKNFLTAFPSGICSVHRSSVPVQHWEQVIIELEGVCADADADMCAPHHVIHYDNQDGIHERQMLKNGRLLSGQVTKLLLFSTTKNRETLIQGTWKFKLSEFLILIFWDADKFRTFLNTFCSQSPTVVPVLVSRTIQL